MPKFRITVENPEHSNGAFTQTFHSEEDANLFRKDCELIGLTTGLEIRYSADELGSEALHNSLVASLMGAASGDWIIRNVRTADGWQEGMFLKPQAGDDAVGIKRDEQPLALLHRVGAGYGWRLTRFGYEWYRDTGCMSDSFGDDLVEALDARIL